MINYSNDCNQLARDCRILAHIFIGMERNAWAIHEMICQSAILKLQHRAEAAEKQAADAEYRCSEELVRRKATEIRAEKAAQRACDLESIVQQVCEERNLGRNEIACLKATRDVLQDSIARALEETEKLKHECRMAEERAEKAEAEARYSRQKKATRKAGALVKVDGKMLTMNELTELRLNEAERINERDGRRLEVSLKLLHRLDTECDLCTYACDTDDCSCDECRGDCKCRDCKHTLEGWSNWQFVGWDKVLQEYWP